MIDLFCTFLYFERSLCQRKNWKYLSKNGLKLCVSLHKLHAHTILLSFYYLESSNRLLFWSLLILLLSWGFSSWNFISNTFSICPSGARLWMSYLWSNRLLQEILLIVFSQNASSQHQTFKKIELLELKLNISHTTYDFMHRSKLHR